MPYEKFLSRCQRKNAADQAENRPSAALSLLLLCKSIEISLDKHDGRSLISRARGQVTERADQICQPSGSRTLGGHVASVLLSPL